MSDSATPLSSLRNETGSKRVLCSHCEKILVPIEEERIVIEEKKSDVKPEKSETESDADRKKRNQRREDIHVYITMATIVSIAALVTILKVALQNVIFPDENAQVDANNTLVENA